MPYRKTTSKKFTRFNELMRMWLDKSSERMTQQELADKVGITRITLIGATRLPRAMGYTSLNRFEDILDLDDKARMELEQAWLDDWLTTRKTGLAVKVFIEAALVGKSAKERQVLYAEALRVLRRDEETEHNTSRK